MEREFPREFLWGGAVAANQCEGACWKMASCLMSLIL